MRISLSWLKKIIDFNVTAEQLADALTNLGLEVPEIVTLNWSCQKVVIGQITEANPHNNADHLRVCKVLIQATEDPLQIVCGAPNARAGIKVAVALVGAELPGNIHIKAAKLRGVESCGMLCSSQELGLDSGWGENHGIMELAPDAPVGQNLANYLGLPDTVLDIELTPNRGDCLSIIGIARELVALGDPNYGQWTPLGKQLLNLESSVSPTTPTAPSMVTVEATALAPHYCLAKLTVDNSLPTPDWMKSALIATGLRSVNLVVDITNYVMIELGQPLHAFDAAKVKGEIKVRLNYIHETEIELLNHQTLSLDPDTLVIADQEKPLAVAGIMGGACSSTSTDSQVILLESAFFEREKISREVQSYNLSTDASYRYERGVDYLLPSKALNRAITLFRQLANGELLSAQVVRHDDYLPVVPPFGLSWNHVTAMLGEQFVTQQVAQTILQHLGIQTTESAPGCWQLKAPSHRFDLQIEEDAIEEIARLVGYNNLSTLPISAELNCHHLSEATASLNRLRDRLISMGYSEAISYSFVDEKLQQQLQLASGQLILANPIYRDSKALRCSLWSGLLPLVQHNLQHGNEQIRLLELGRVFKQNEQEIEQPYHLAGVLTGDYAPKQWASDSRKIDFYDLKADLEQLLGAKLSYRNSDLACLHPGRSAQVYLSEQFIGYVGQLHPRLQTALHLKLEVWLWELSVEKIMDIAKTKKRYQEPSKYPRITRDLSLVVPDNINWQTLEVIVRSQTTIPLTNVLPFDIYRGSELPTNHYGIAVRLVFRSNTDTLTDQAVEQWMTQILVDLKQKGIQLRY